MTSSVSGHKACPALPAVSPVPGQVSHEKQQVWGPCESSRRKPENEELMPKAQSRGVCRLGFRLFHTMPGSHCSQAGDFGGLLLIYTSMGRRIRLLSGAFPMRSPTQIRETHLSGCRIRFPSPRVRASPEHGVWVSWQSPFHPWGQLLGVHAAEGFGGQTLSWCKLALTSMELHQFTPLRIGA